MTAQDTDERGPRERAYDEEIYPLMARIIAIAQRADIAMVAHYLLDDSLDCITAIPAKAGYSDSQRVAIEALYTPGPVTFGVIIRRGDTLV